jgi:hypothetical protein
MILEIARENPRVVDVGIIHWIRMKIEPLQAWERRKNVVERRRSAHVMAKQENFDMLSNMRMRCEELGEFQGARLYGLTVISPEINSSK